MYNSPFASERLVILKNSTNFIVIVLLVLIIAIQAGSLFARAASGNCDAALTAADELIQGGNTNTAALMADSKRRPQQT